MTPKHPTIEVRRRKRRAIAKIHRDAERKRTELGFVPDPTALRDRRILFAALIVLSVLGVCLIGQVNKMNEARRNRPMMRQLREIDTLAIALGRYHFHVGAWPTKEQGLKVLLRGPKGISAWQGPYITRFNNDAFGTPYVYAPPEGDAQVPTLFSCGPDRLPNTPDDVHPSSPAKFDPGTAWTNGWLRGSQRYLNFK